MKWSDGDSIASFELFFDDGLDCDTMVQAIIQRSLGSLLLRVVLSSLDVWLGLDLPKL